MATFGAAFAAARKKLGAGKTFTWNGKSYSTNTAEDEAKKKSKSAPDKSKRPQPNPKTPPKVDSTPPKAPAKPAPTKPLVAKDSNALTEKEKMEREKARLVAAEYARTKDKPKRKKELGANIYTSAR